MVAHVKHHKSTGNIFGKFCRAKGILGNLSIFGVKGKEKYLKYKIDSFFGIILYIFFSDSIRRISKIV